ncbi:universal stress protein [Neptuniibacter sp. QD48_55]|uniref:universal stress protein n=1 Tax=unclassified Neptuniibacter TaxID=2630693 RepID=UPI0039F60400
MFKKILVPLDLQDGKAVEQTLQTVKEYIDESVELHLMTILSGYQMPMVASYFPKGAVEKALEAMRKELQTIGAKALDNRGFEVDVREGKAHKEIVRRAKEIEADLIIMSAQKHGAVEKVMLGSVTAKVTERAKCSVLVLKG